MRDDVVRHASPAFSISPAPSVALRVGGEAAEPLREGLDAIDAELLAAIAEDYLPLLGSATSIHDRSGGRALGLFPAGWCAYLDRTSRPEHEGGGATGRSACQGSCWQTSLAAIERGREIQQPCGSGIEMFAVPIRAGNRIVGAINAAIGEPPRSEQELTRLATAYGVEPAELARHAAAFPQPSAAAVETAKRRLRHAAQLIGEMVARRAAESERERLFRAEAQARARLQRLQEATAALAAALTPDQVAQATIEAGVVGFGAPRGRLLLLSRDALEFELLASAGYEAAHMEQWRRIRNEGPLAIVDAARRAEPIVIGRLAEYLSRYPALAQWAALSGFHGSAVFPLVVGGERARRVLGVVCFDFEQDRDFQPDEIQYLQTLASLSAQAMDRALAYAAERAARVEAEYANKAKASFLAAMSHELRTPLNAIGGYTQLLEMGLHGPTTPAQLDVLGRIAFNGKHLLSQINNILDFARLEAGRVTYEIEELSLDALLEDVARVVEPMIALKALVYEVELPHPAPVVRADAARLRQVIVNLVANATKFTEAGGRIRVVAATSPGTVELCVCDTGAGIAPENLETIFHPFERGESTYVRRTEGAGLGLAIARDLTRGMGGDVVVRSALGEGSIFLVSLPAA